MLRFYPPFNSGDASSADGILADDWVDIPSGREHRAGSAGFADMIRRLKGFMPDSRIEIINVITDGDRAAVHSNIHGTPQGDLLGIHFAAKPISMMTMDVHAIVGGRISTTWHVEDRFGLMRQFGLPHPARRERDA